MNSLLALVLVFAFAQDSGVPTLTTDDVRPFEAQVVAGPELDAMWQKIYDGMQRDPKVDKADVEQLRARIESGQEISVSVRIMLDGNSGVTGVAVDQGTGIASIDREINTIATSMPQGATFGPDFRGFRQFAVQAGVSKTRLRLSGSSIAPSPERAAELQRQIEAFGAELEKGVSNGAALGRGLSVTRDGASIAVSFSLDLAQLAPSVR